MTSLNFPSKLNWRLMLIDFIACWLFIYAFSILIILHDFTFKMSLWDLTSVKNLENHRFFPGDGERLTHDALWANLSGIIGGLTALLISLLLSFRKRWYWLNSVVAFIIAYILWRFHVSGWRYLRMVFLLPGRLFSIYTPWRYLTDGLVMLTLGLLLLFSTVSINLLIRIQAQKQLSSLRSVHNSRAIIFERRLAANDIHFG